MKREIPVPCDFQDAEHLDRLDVEVPLRHRQQLAVSQHEAFSEQCLIGLGRDRGRTQRVPQERGFKHMGQPDHIPGVEKIMPHETFNAAALPAMGRITHPRTDDGLQIEGQPFLGACRDIVKVKTDGPQKFPGPFGVSRFRLRQDPPTSASSPIVDVPYT